MKKHQFKKIGLFVCVAALVASVQICVADLADASGTLADIGVISTQASTALATAANSGDIEAIAEAQKRADAVDAAMAEAQEAYAAMERAVTSGDDDAAASAADDLAAAHQKAEDALNGAVPEPTPQSLKDQWKESQTNTGGGPGQAYDPPNIYHIPSQTAGQQSSSAATFSTINAAGGGSFSGNESDATPE